MDPFLRLARALRRSGVRFVVIGLSGINLHARSASEVFATQDRDLFVPPDPDAIEPTFEAFLARCAENGIPRNEFSVVPGFYEDTLSTMSASA